MYVTFQDLCNSLKGKDEKHIIKITLKLLQLNTKPGIHITNLNHFPWVELGPSIILEMSL